MDLPMSYAEAQQGYNDRLAKGTLARGIRLGNNTYLTWENCAPHTPQWFGVRLYDTDVVVFHADGRIELDSGGWNTVTTKSRMNACLADYSVYSNRKVWYVEPLRDYSQIVLPVPTKCLKLRKVYGEARKFKDGFIIHPEGLFWNEENERE